MRRPIKLFVSAGPDLERERDVIGRVVADLPVDVGWEIGRTPLVRGRSGGQDTDMAEAFSPAVAANCDFFIFLLGRDITAPAGAEWDAARSTSRPVLALLKDVARTPAGQEFQRYALELWFRYESFQDLKQQVRTALVGYLLRTPERFGLTLPEVERLMTVQQEEVGQPRPEDQESSAAGGGVIMPTPREADW